MSDETLLGLEHRQGNARRERGHGEPFDDDLASLAMSWHAGMVHFETAQSVRARGLRVRTTEETPQW